MMFIVVIGNGVLLHFEYFNGILMADIEWWERERRRFDIEKGTFHSV